MWRNRPEESSLFCQLGLASLRRTGSSRCLWMAQAELVSVLALPFLTSDLLPSDHPFNPLQYIHRNISEKLTHTIKYFNKYAVFFRDFCNQEEKAKEYISIRISNIITKWERALFFSFLNSKTVSSQDLLIIALPWYCWGDELKIHSGDQVLL